MFEEKRTRA